MGVLAVQAVPNVPDSLLLIDSTAADISGKGADAAGAGGLFLNIGAHSSMGMLERLYFPVTPMQHECQSRSTY